jgi:hypothetical protein
MLSNGSSIATAMDNFLDVRWREVNDLQRTQVSHVASVRSAALPCYRAFLLDISGHVFAVRLLITHDQTAALRLAQRIQTQCDMIEVWHGTNKIGLLEPRNRLP